MFGFVFVINSVLSFLLVLVEVSVLYILNNIKTLVVLNNIMAKVKKEYHIKENTTTKPQIGASSLKISTMPLLFSNSLRWQLFCHGNGV